MYTVSKGPSKIVAKSRRGLSQNFEKFETIKESGKKFDINSPEKLCVPRPVFHTVKKPASSQKVEEKVISPQHEEIIKYINDSWNIIVAQNPYDSTCDGIVNGVNGTNGVAAPADSNNNFVSTSNSTSASSSAFSSTSTSPACSPQPGATPLYCIEPPSPVLSDFQPFDLESWWGRRLFNNITKNL